MFSKLRDSGDWGVGQEEKPTSTSECPPSPPSSRSSVIESRLRGYSDSNRPASPSVFALARQFDVQPRQMPEFREPSEARKSTEIREALEARTQPEIHSQSDLPPAPSFLSQGIKRRLSVREDGTPPKVPSRLQHQSSTPP